MLYFRNETGQGRSLKTEVGDKKWTKVLIRGLHMSVKVNGIITRGGSSVTTSKKHYQKYQLNNTHLNSEL